jgi:choline-glycine betaine transporter
MPLYILVIDYILGIIMWTLIGRSAMNIFQKEDSEFFFMKVFVKYTNPIIKIFKFITPSFIIGPLVPLYVAWFFYITKIYKGFYLKKMGANIAPNKV